MLQTKYDVIVVGGGLAGCGAAVGAAQAGADVLLLEATGVLGGLGVNGLVNPFMKFDQAGIDLAQGFFAQLVAKLKADNAYQGRAFDPESLKYNLSKLLQQVGVDILLYHQVVDLKTVADKITEVTTFAQGERSRYQADQFIDCSGDAVLGKLADLTVFTGEETTGCQQALTQMFILEGVDLAATLDYVRYNPEEFMDWVTPEQTETATSIAGFFSQVAAAKADGWELPCDYFFFVELPRKGAVVVNTGHIEIKEITAREVSNAQLIGWQQTKQLTDFARQYLPGFDGCYLSQSANQIGIRESGRIKGNYIFTRTDVETGAKFPDAVVKGAYGVDIHSDELDEETEGVTNLAEDYYEIPVRSLIAAQLDNLLMGGRNLSADFGAQSAARIMPTSCGMGQGAGVAAALAVAKKISPAEVGPSKLQTELKRQGVNIRS